MCITRLSAGFPDSMPPEALPGKGYLADLPAQQPSSDPRTKQGHAPRLHARATGQVRTASPAASRLLYSSLPSAWKGPKPTSRPPTAACSRAPSAASPTPPTPFALALLPGARLPRATACGAHRGNVRRGAGLSAQGVRSQTAASLGPGPRLRAGLLATPSMSPADARCTERLPACVAAPTQPRAPAPTRRLHPCR